MNSDSLHDYAYMESAIKALEGNWGPEVDETIRRRKVRNIDASVRQMRADRKIAEDCTYIPRRIADANIRREQAPYLAYITQARDAAKFRPLTPMGGLQPDVLEREFTTFVQYDGWQVPLFQCIDGCQTHGWDAIEVVFDQSKPGHFGLFHIGHENLMFDWDILDIQQSSKIQIVRGMTIPELIEGVDEYDFNKTQVDEIIERLRSKTKTYEVRAKMGKIFFKDETDLDSEGRPIVYVGWRSEHASDWVKKPERLFLGRSDKVSDIPETDYPIYPLRYTVSENEMLTQTKGRVFMDEHDQEACTVLITAFTNRAQRSSYLIFTPKNPTDGTASKQTEIKIGDGRIFENAVDLFQITPPDASMLNALMAITTENSQELGQVNFAVANRKDSRKTAEEVKMATQQSAMLNSVQVAMLSIWLRGVYQKCWQILKSQVQQGKVKSSLTNWELYYSAEYMLLAAGDVDVVRRMERLSAMKQDWPVIQNTGAARVFLEEIVRNSPYADIAQKIIDAMAQGDRKENLLKGAARALLQITNDKDVGQVVQTKYAGELQELKQEFMTVMAPPGAKMPEGIQDNAPVSGGEQYPP